MSATGDGVGTTERLLAVAMVVVSVALVGWTLSASAGLGLLVGVDDAIWILGAGGFAATGAVIVRAHPRHAIGWAFLWIGLLFAVTNAGLAYGVLGVGRPLPLAAVAAWLATWTWAPALGLVVLSVAVFPDGRPVNRVVGVVAGLGLGASSVIAIVNASVLWPLRDARMALPGAEAELDNVVPTVIGVLFPVILIAALVALSSLIVRFRRADGAERRQLKWLAVAALVMVPGIVGGQLLPDGSLGRTAGEVLGVPVWFAVAAGVAVLRYRLYDVDRIVSRTLSYLFITGVLVVLYAGSVMGLGSAARAVAGESGDIVVALSTLLVASAFQPVRLRVQRAVDRRFNRARVDALRAADDFGRRLRDEVELGAVVEDLRRTVVATLQPTSARVMTVGADMGSRA